MVASKSPADAVHEALRLDQVAFPKHLNELATMLKEIETKLKPTIAKYVPLLGVLLTALKLGLLCVLCQSCCGVGMKKTWLLTFLCNLFFIKKKPYVTFTLASLSTTSTNGIYPTTSSTTNNNNINKTTTTKKTDWTRRKSIPQRAFHFSK